MKALVRNCGWKVMTPAETREEFFRFQVALLNMSLERKEIDQVEYDKNLYDLCKIAEKYNSVEV